MLDRLTQGVKATVDAMHNAEIPMTALTTCEHALRLSLYPDIPGCGRNEDLKDNGTLYYR